MPFDAIFIMLIHHNKELTFSFEFILIYKGRILHKPGISPFLDHPALATSL